MSKRSRRNVIKSVGAATIVGLAGCSSDGGSGSGSQSDGGDGGGSGGDGSDGSDGGSTGSGQQDTNSGNEPYNIGFVNMGLSGDPWLLSFQNGVDWYAQDHDAFEVSLTHGEFSAQKQVTRSQDLLRQGVDALIVSPLDSEGLVTVVEAAAEENVPVFTANSTAATADVKLFTAFGNDTAASACGDTIVQRLEERYGSPEGSVLEIMMPQETRTFIQRHEGFVNRIDKEDDIELVQSVRVDEASTADVTQKLTPVLQRNPDIDAVYAPDFNTGLGITAALENNDMDATVDEGKDHVITSCIDASKTVLNQIQEGYIDSVVDQPNIFYGPITMEYIKAYLDAGKDDSVLPQPGDEVTADDLTIDGNQHLGVDPWAEPIWAPANARAQEFDDGNQTQLATKEIVIEQGDDLVDAPFIWGNLSQKY